MVSSTVALAGAIAFLVLFIGPVVYLTWLSYKQDQHSPAAVRGDDDADAESA